MQGESAHSCSLVRKLPANLPTVPCLMVQSSTRIVESEFFSRPCGRGSTNVIDSLGSASFIEWDTESGVGFYAGLVIMPTEGLMGLAGRAAPNQGAVALWSGSPAAFMARTRSRRARATRERMVPIGHPHTSAAAA
jgi:hypothetical protein